MPPDSRLLSLVLLPRVVWLLVVLGCFCLDGFVRVVGFTFTCLHLQLASASAIVDAGIRARTPKLFGSCCTAVNNGMLRMR